MSELQDIANNIRVKVIMGDEAVKNVTPGKVAQAIREVFENGEKISPETLKEAQSVAVKIAKITAEEIWLNETSDHLYVNQQVKGEDIDGNAVYLYLAFNHKE